MIEILQFIFQSFWHFLGTIILLAQILTGLYHIFPIVLFGKEGTEYYKKMYHSERNKCDKLRETIEELRGK